ncbi:PREDICTED: uncharacterized protein LOC101299073 [Fragaria vesca subsp. vesca]
MDKTLRTTVLIFRSLTDFLLLTHIVAQILDRVHTDYEIPPQLGSKPGFHKEFDSDTEDRSDYWFFVSSLIIKCLAVLPIPQVAILVGFFRLGGTDFSITRKFLNMSLVLQYLPRVSQIYLSRSKFSMGGKWARPAFNLFLYILASHVLGALWYFFAIERETSCWHRACRKTAGCIASAYKCSVSVFMQSATTNALESEKLRQIKIAENKGEIVKWMKSNNLPDDTKETIKTAIREYKVLEKKLIIDVDVKYFVNDTPFSIRIKQPILEHLGLDLLKGVPIFANTPDDKLRSLCHLMIPVTYSRNAAFVNADQPLDQMIFIIRGEIEFVGTTGDPSYRRREHKYLGKVLERWMAFNFLKRSYCDPLPNLAGGYIKACDLAVEALALKAWDILRFAEQTFDVKSPHLIALASAHKSTVDHETKEDPLIRSVLPLLWEPPAVGWVKLNCSYVWNPDSKWAAFGCVLRNDKGELINVASVGNNNHKYIDKFHAGASCIWSLMKFSVQLVKTGQIIVESDDKFLIDFLEQGPMRPDERVRGILRPVLQDIASEVSKFKVCKFAHCKRQTNAAAVRVAEHAVHVTEPKTWKKPEEIPELVDALKKDSPHLYKSLREQKLADQKVNIDSGSSTSAVGAALSSKETIVEVKES